MFKAMAEIDEFHGDNPVEAISALKSQKTEMSYFTESEVKRLLSLCTGDYFRIAGSLACNWCEVG